MVAFTGKFDGRVIVPDQPVNLPQNERLMIRVEQTGAGVVGVKGAELLTFAGTISADDARTMSEAIEEGCERVDPHGW